MSVSATSSIQPSGLPDSLVPKLASENATTALAQSANSSSSSSSSNEQPLHMFAEGDDSPSFWDLVDVINPLQHIPIVNDIYREATGDKIGVAARLAGGALFGGGVFGLIGAALNCVLEESTGKDAGGHVLALFKDDAPSATAVASATEPNPVADADAAAAATKTADAGPMAAVSPPPKAAPANAQAMVMDLMGGDAPKTSPAAAQPAAPAAQPRPPVDVSTDELSAPTGAASVAASVSEGDAVAAGKTMQLRNNRFMATPPRTTAFATRSPPALGVATSQTGARSNVPVTGARPNNQPIALSPQAMQQLVAAQADASGVKPAPTPVSTNAAKSDTAPTGDWFSAAMAQGLEKYERSGKLGQPDTISP